MMKLHTINTDEDVANVKFVPNWLCVFHLLIFPSSPDINAEGRPGDFCLPPVWNLRAASLIPLFYKSQRKAGDF